MYGGEDIPFVNNFIIITPFLSVPSKLVMIVLSVEVYVLLE